jgi:hypothetical protein
MADTDLKEERRLEPPRHAPFACRTVAVEPLSARGSSSYSNLHMHEQVTALHPPFDEICDVVTVWEAYVICWLSCDRAHV